LRRCEWHIRKIGRCPAPALPEPLKVDEEEAWLCPAHTLTVKAILARHERPFRLLEEIKRLREKGEPGW